MAKLTVLSNGVIVITQENPGVNSVALAINVEAGARNERSDQYGFAHFIEHMLFKGTDEYNAEQLMQEFDALGASVNAYTDYENTLYYANCLNSAAPKVLQLLHDMYFKSTFNAKELELERKVVLEEFGVRNDDPNSCLYDRFITGLYAGSTFGHSILGDKEIIRTATQLQLLEFYKSNYTARNTTIIASGNIKHGEMVGLVGKLSFNEVPSNQVNEQIEIRNNLIVNHNFREMDQTLVMIGYRSIGHAHEMYTASKLFTQILGESMGSLLHQEVREKRGLAYSVGAQDVFTTGECIKLIYLGTSPHQAVEAIELCKNIVGNFTITEKQLQDAKVLAESKLLMDYDFQTRQVCKLSEQYLYQRFLTPINDEIEAINSVTLNDLKDIADRLVELPPRIETLGTKGYLD